MADKNKLHPPKTDALDVGHAIAKAGISSVPVLGSAAAELFALVVTPSMERRRQKWMEEVAEALSKLEERGRIRFEDLKNDEAFIDTVLVASQAAMRTTNAEKREALRDAVANSALPHRPEDALRQTFVALVDQFTEWHLRLLKFFQDPQGWAKANGMALPSLMAGSPAHILEEAMPALRGKREFYDQVWTDLSQRGLVNTNSLGGLMTGQGTLAKRTSEMGDTFLAFISEPNTDTPP